VRKAELDFVTTFVLAVLAGAFIALGAVFANTVVPSGLFIKQLAPPEFWRAIGQTPAQYDSLRWGSFLSRNLFPVALGNVMGGAVMVWAVYWFIYRRGQPRRKGP
jgi:formate transporter